LFFSIVSLLSGLNSYYILQLIEADKSKQYWVFRKWGRVGTESGGTKLTEYGSDLSGAKQEFHEVFYEKTFNQWSARAQFVKKPGKFMLVDVDYGEDPLDAAQAAADAPSTSKLDKPIQDLIRILFDVQQIKKTLLSMDIDLNKMPLGKLSRKHIQSGFTVLTNIQEAIKAEVPDEARLLALSNQFYTLIPHDFGRNLPTVLRTEEEIKSKIEMVETLLEVGLNKML
jgi:predicted DNA-binding WGR domain protein